MGAVKATLTGSGRRPIFLNIPSFRHRTLNTLRRGWARWLNVRDQKQFSIMGSDIACFSYRTFRCASRSERTDWFDAHRRLSCRAKFACTARQSMEFPIGAQNSAQVLVHAGLQQSKAETYAAGYIWRSYTLASTASSGPARDRRYCHCANRKRVSCPSPYVR